MKTGSDAFHDVPGVALNEHAHDRLPLQIGEALLVFESEVGHGF